MQDVPVHLRRSPGPSFKSIAAQDAVLPAAHFFEEKPFFEGTQDIPVSRYTSREFFELEKEHVWRQVWQMACREEHVPVVGDTYVYDICDMSFVIVRSAENTIRAFWNVCNHRGRQLVSQPGRMKVLRCPFHGFSWNLDGSLAFVPTEWDFPHIEGDDFGLHEVQVDVWGGFVFIKPRPVDEGGETLTEYLGELVDHFAPWHMETRFIEAHVAKVFNANWKVVEEAFMESFHVAGTHPQQMVRLGDVNTQYDCYENFSRALHPSGTPSPLLNWVPTEQEMLESLLDVREGEEAPVQIPEGETLRSFAAQIGRAALRPAIGDEADAVSDAELIDAMEYTILPNFHPWASYQRAVYRFRPHGDSHEQAVMEVMLISPFEGERPAPAKCAWLGVDEPWTKPDVLGITGRILDQDSTNIAKLQVGLRSAPIAGLRMSSYQESRIRHFHAWLEKRIAAGEVK